MRDLDIPEGGLVQQDASCRLKIVKLLEEATAKVPNAVPEPNSPIFEDASEPVLERQLGVHLASLVDGNSALEELFTALQKQAAALCLAEKPWEGTHDFNALRSEVKASGKALQRLLQEVRQDEDWQATATSLLVVLKAWLCCRDMQGYCDSYIESLGDDRSVTNPSSSNPSSQAVTSSTRAASSYASSTTYVSSATASTAAPSSTSTTNVSSASASTHATSSTASTHPVASQSSTSESSSHGQSLRTAGSADPEAEMWRLWGAILNADDLAKLKERMNPMFECTRKVVPSDFQVLILENSESAQLFSVANVVVREAVSGLRRWYKTKECLEELTVGFLDVIASSPGTTFGEKALKDFLATGDALWSGEKKWAEVCAKVMQLPGLPKGLIVLCKDIILLAGACVAASDCPDSGRPRFIANAVASGSHLQFALLSSQNGRLRLWKRGS
mmetsp:Transcript_64477/g.153943  ORF Transcript_64477/g.153943 Transcript_64477/m.153943 type:complete len:447 (+) Transcript_64477:107-1447(+)|eukprot:CAMPEP_0178423470 /NCGR_PEP_ID=MMETSP0689_2-20121128/27705_1 /TAXON_ID=160604 /ORGANISM="Amphidinium massartii, Strain CS-259" /LENGTH=446 /DNA_ID=CAMNT_0020045065 /DNA_START=20 /DNA_END=1360 /DNA_ORIENTATION=+